MSDQREVGWFRRQWRRWAAFVAENRAPVLDPIDWGILKPIAAYPHIKPLVLGILGALGTLWAFLVTCAAKSDGTPDSQSNSSPATYRRTCSAGAAEDPTCPPDGIDELEDPDVGVFGDADNGRARKEPSKRRKPKARQVPVEAKDEPLTADVGLVLPVAVTDRDLAIQPDTKRAVYDSVPIKPHHLMRLGDK